MTLLVFFTYVESYDKCKLFICTCYCLFVYVIVAIVNVMPKLALEGVVGSKTLTYQ